ncbi:MAG: GDSL-type esterase/lipase family protein [Bacteroidota bacterium]
MKIYSTSGFRYGGVLLISFLLCLHTKGQEISSRYPFILENLNHLYFSNDSASFLNLYKKLDKFSEGKKNKITVVHMGGSHVQGGTWSSTFLTGLQNEFKTDGGGYFMFPYRIAKTNSQPYVTSFTNGKWKRCRAVGKEFCLPLGMSAMSVNTNDSINYFGVAITQRSVLKKFNSVRVYHNFNKSFEFDVSAKNMIMTERTDHEKMGYTSFKLSASIDSVSFNLLRKDTLQKDFILYGFSLENDMSPGFYLAGLGANGASTSSFLRCAGLVPQLQSLDADLMILSLGVNDTQSKNFAKEEYIEHYDSLITFAKKANPGVAIILTTTTDNYIKRRTSNKRTVMARDAMFELMERYDLAVWDLYSIMGGYKSMARWYKSGLASKDKVHFSPKGYTLVGNLMFEALIKSYNNYKKRKE